MRRDLFKLANEEPALRLVEGDVLELTAERRIWIPWLDDGADVGFWTWETELVQELKAHGVAFDILKWRADLTSAGHRYHLRVRLRSTLTVPAGAAPPDDPFAQGPYPLPPADPDWTPTPPGPGDVIEPPVIEAAAVAPLVLIGVGLLSVIVVSFAAVEVSQAFVELSQTGLGADVGTALKLGAFALLVFVGILALREGRALAPS